jgi:Lysyl oxidase
LESTHLLLQPPILADRSRWRTNDVLNHRKALCTAAGLALLLPVLSARPAAALGDLVVREDIMSAQWVVREEKLGPNFCSVIEGGVEPGLRRLVRFTVTTENRGADAIHVGDPLEHVAAGDGLFEFAGCHDHYHFRNYALYELVDPATGHVWRAAKRGFCMLDTDPVPMANGNEPPRNPTYRSCGTTTISGNQGVSANWADTYRFYLGGQYFVLDGGDGQPVVPAGTYLLRVTANPPFLAAGDEACPYLDGNGFCHMLPESDYSNNVGQVSITIPDRVGRHGVGPLAGSDHLNHEPADH